MDQVQASDDMRWERLAGLGGIVFGVILLGVFFLDTTYPGDNAPAGELLTYMTADTGARVVYALLSGIGMLALLWCLGSFRSIQARAEDNRGRLSTVVFAAGVLTVGLLAGALAFEWSMAIAEEFFGAFEADPQTGLALLGAGSLFFAFADIAAGFAVGTAAIVMLRTKTFPRWFAWASLVSAVPILAAALVDVTFLLFPMWAIVIGALIMRGVSTGSTQALAG